MVGKLRGAWAEGGTFLKGRAGRGSLQSHLLGRHLGNGLAGDPPVAQRPCHARVAGGLEVQRLGQWGNSREGWGEKNDETLGATRGCCLGSRGHLEDLAFL